MSQLPLQWDPVEYKQRAVDLTPIERVKEAIYEWMDADTDTAEDLAWDRFRHACTDWIRDEARERVKREQLDLIAEQDPEPGDNR